MKSVWLPLWPICRTQLIPSALIGLASLTAFFFLALRLSPWSLRPAELARESQPPFIADASHELKTPLTVILANVRLLSSDPDIPPGKTGFAPKIFRRKPGG